VIVFGALLSGLDASIVAVGLDTIARNLDADLATAQWVATGPAAVRRPDQLVRRLTSAFTGAALFGAALLFPLFLQIGRGADPLASGVLLISLSVGTIVVLPLSGRLVDRIGGGVVAVAGGSGGSRRRCRPRSCRWTPPSRG